jgi:hypothetical protein
VRPHRLHLDAGHGLGRSDEHVRRPSGRELDGEVVDGVAVTALDDVDAEDVGACVAEGGGDGPEAARLVRQYDPEQERHATRPLADTPHRGRLARQHSTRDCVRPPAPRRNSGR